MPFVKIGVCVGGLVYGGRDLDCETCSARGDITSIMCSPFLRMNRLGLGKWCEGKELNPTLPQTAAYFHNGGGHSNCLLLANGKLFRAFLRVWLGLICAKSGADLCKYIPYNVFYYFFYSLTQWHTGLSLWLSLMWNLNLCCFLIIKAGRGCI